MMDSQLDRENKRIAEGMSGTSQIGGISKRQAPIDALHRAVRNSESILENVDGLLRQITQGDTPHAAEKNTRAEMVSLQDALEGTPRQINEITEQTGQALHQIRQILGL